MVAIYVKENVSKMFRGLRDNLTIQAKGSGNSIPAKIVRWGKWKAISIAPHDTGATKRAIQIIEGTAKTPVRLRLNQPQNARMKVQRDYHLWMHDIGKHKTSKYVTKTGDPKFMFTTAKKMEKRMIKQMNKQIDKLIK